MSNYLYYNIPNQYTDSYEIYQNHCKLDFDNLDIISNNKSSIELDVFNNTNLDNNSDDSFKFDLGKFFFHKDSEITKLTTRNETVNYKKNELTNEISENNEVTTKRIQFNAIKDFDNKVRSLEYHNVEFPFYLGKKRYRDEDDDFHDQEITNSIFLTSQISWDESHFDHSKFFNSFGERTISDNIEIIIDLEEYPRVPVKNNSIFRIEKKKKYFEIGKLTSEETRSVNSLQTSIAESPCLHENQKIIESRKFADDSINKKIKTDCFKCLSNNTSIHDLFSQKLITNVNITDNKILNQTTLRDLIDQAFEEKHAKLEKTLKSLKKKELEKCLESKKISLNMTFGDFYQTVYLESNELKTKLEKVEYKEELIYYQKFQFRVKTYISYFETNKGNQPNKKKENPINPNQKKSN